MPSAAPTAPVRQDPHRKIRLTAAGLTPKALSTAMSRRRSMASMEVAEDTFTAATSTTRVIMNSKSCRVDR